MLLYSIDILSELADETLVLVGYDGTAVSTIVDQHAKGRNVKCLWVCEDDGRDKEPCTAGDLKKCAKAIVDGLSESDLLLLCVGDQPFMQLETLRDFVSRHVKSQADASILLSDVRGTPMEQSTSTRVSVIGSGRLFFDTPPKRGPFESYSTLMDVGVILITKAAFVSSVKKVKAEDVFSKLLCYLPDGDDKLNSVRARNPYQFINVNVKDDAVLDIPEPLFPPPSEPTAQRFIDRSEILLRWLEWNIVDDRRKEFDIFSFPETYRPEFEVDTTLFCRGTPACSPDCTYRQKHMKVFLDQDVGKYSVQRAKTLGFFAVLFSGGGENLEDEAYGNFLQILKTAKEAGLRTNLATNGVNLNPTRIQELIHHLDSIRFSIPPVVGRSYSHLGLIAPSICLARKLISDQYLETILYANFLMVPSMPMEELEADILLVSQLGVDGIRFKGQHEWTDGCFVLRPGAYSNHVRAIRSIEQHKDLALPPITISKLERMMQEPVGARPFHACWYRDFNPLVLGCDSHNYACCEMKYEKAFDYGEVTPSKDNLKALTRCCRKPQSVDPKYCFRGCKGYLVNVDLQRLLNDYETRGKNIFDDPKNVEVRDRVLHNLVRSVLTN